MFWLLPSFPFCFEQNSKHHKSPYTNAAIVLCIIGFCLNFTVPLAVIPALFASFTVYMTGCCRVHQKCLYVAVVLAILSSICAFVVLAAVTKSNETSEIASNRKTLKIMSILGGLVWMATAYVIYKIPGPDSTVPDPNNPSSDSHNSNGPSSFDHPTV